MEEDKTGQDVKSLEHSTLKVPYEILNKKFRTAQKVFDRETAHVSLAGSELDKLLATNQTTNSTSVTSVSRCSSTNSSSKKKKSRRSLGNEDSVDSTNVIVAAPPKLTASNEEIRDTSSIAASVLTRQDSVISTLSARVEDGSMDLDSTSMKGDSIGRSVDSGVSISLDSKKGPQGRDVSKLLGALVDRLSSLKRKAGESISEELDSASMVRKRVQHLKSYSSKADGNSLYSSDSSGLAGWKRTRLHRMLVDHLLREGMYETSKLLATNLHIEDLTNIEVFWAAKEVEESLKRHETNRMVAWCYENKSKLRKIHSTLELEIRVQEFVELVRQGKRFDAVKHARKYLAETEDPEHIQAVKKCMGLLAFPAVSTGKAIHPYYDLLSDDRWANLVGHFRAEHARLYQLPSTSVLGTVVQAGLAALKTPHCYKANTKNPNCPVCTEPLSTLADVLPYAHCAHSQLVCAISGEPLNENNPALVLPSGYVYGTKSLKEMARLNGGMITCIRSGQKCEISEAERVFVM
jgi:macrophage erythroblast attacher